MRMFACSSSRRSILTFYLSVQTKGQLLKDRTLNGVISGLEGSRLSPRMGMVDDLVQW